MNVQRRDPSVVTTSFTGNVVLTWKFAEAIFPIHFVANWSNHIRVQIYFTDQPESNVYESWFKCFVKFKGSSLGRWWHKGKILYGIPCSRPWRNHFHSNSFIIKLLFDIQPTCLMVHQLVPLYRKAETQQLVLFNAESLNITFVMRRIHTISSFFIS